MIFSVGAVHMVFMKVRYTYRLRPGNAAKRYLAREWGMSRYVWNELVAQSKAIHEAWPSILLSGAEKVTFGAAGADKFLTQLRATTIDAEGRHWLAEGSSVVQQQTVRDFSASRTKALKDILAKKGAKQRAGLPRFRRKGTSLPTLNYTTRGFSLKEDTSGVVCLALPGGVSIPVVWSRVLPSTPSSVRVYQDSLGHWYASFVVEEPALAHVPARSKKVIGIDWGVSETATTVLLDLHTRTIDETTVFDLPHPEHGKKAAAGLAVSQRRMARRRKPKGHAESHGYRKAKFLSAKAHKKVARQRKDDANKWAKKVASEHEHIAVEDFKPKFLAKSTMAKKSADAGIAAVKEALVWQAHKHGRDLRLVHPRNTTTDCFECDARTKHRLPLGQRTYTCERCGVSRPRDKNSAAIIAARAGFLPADIEGINLNPAAALDLVA